MLKAAHLSDPLYCASRTAQVAFKASKMLNASSRVGWSKYFTSPIHWNYLFNFRWTLSFSSIDKTCSRCSRWFCNTLRGSLYHSFKQKYSPLHFLIDDVECYWNLDDALRRVNGIRLYRNVHMWTVEVVFISVDLSNRDLSVSQFWIQL